MSQVYLDLTNKQTNSDIPGYLSGIYKQLTDQGIMKTLMGIVEKYGKPKAIEY